MTPISTSRPPSMVDWRTPDLRLDVNGPGAWLTAGRDTTGALVGAPSGMRQPYPGAGRCQGPSAPARRDRGRGTEVVQHAFGAPRRPCHADPAAVQDQAQAEAGPLRRRDQFRDLGFDFGRVGAPGQAQPAGQPGDVGGDGEPGNAEGDAQHDVGGLPPHPRQGAEVLPPVRYLSEEPLDQRCTDAHYGS